MIWNPWRGCHKISEGCKFCYIHKGDAKRGVNTNLIVKTNDYDKPIQKTKDGQYKIKSGTLVYLCFTSDFLIEEADGYRLECFKMIKERSDLHFLFLTKRIERFLKVIPPDWHLGYDNVTVGVSVSNQAEVDEKISILSKLPIKHKNIICQPLIAPVNLEKYLDAIELVVVGGESDKNGRILDYNWVLDIKDQCVRHNVAFNFRQLATHFKKDNTIHYIPTNLLTKQAKKANIDFNPSDT